ncbi:MAG: ribonuclease III [Phycisphaerales bacterium]|jgi:ribonuclease-3|nr:ribonuclease III [Phycisphaerales bacterium]
MDDATLTKAEDLLEYDFADRAILNRALTHASTAATRHESNERLEFLGDAVLGLVVCEFLHRNHPELLEGEMTKVKSAVVSRRICAEEARRLGLDQLLVLGKGMAAARELPSSVAAAVWESIIGALYVDGGLPVAEDFILTALKPRIEQAVRSGHHHNFKSVLQQVAQQRFGSTPVYSVLDEQGPDHAKCFEVGVTISGRSFQPRWGPNKKRAEQDAALAALEELDVAEVLDDGEIRVSD